MSGWVPVPVLSWAIRYGAISPTTRYNGNLSVAAINPITSTAEPKTGNYEWIRLDKSIMASDPNITEIHTGKGSMWAATHLDETPQRQFVQELASRKIQGFRKNIDENGRYLNDIYQSVRSLSANIAADYRDRFLIELIQNAYDAHSVGTQDGRIEITLDMREGQYGTLFVANGGVPFCKKNVKSLCDIGLSLKLLAESIGNKGLGFRSVVQITDTPRIYSQCPAVPGRNHFSGFCFRFAEHDDYADLFADPRHLELAQRDLPTFHLPIYLDRQSEAVCDFAEAGSATVIELPLRDAHALESVQREIDHLRDQKVPILLFLDRVSTLRVLTIDRTGRMVADYAFTRSEETLSATDIALSRVELGGSGLFLVCRQAVPEADIKKAIATGIYRKELHEHWAKWAGDGEVAVAVRLDAVVPSSRLYTFLPMGEQAEAPFQGYLHGSFSTSANRKSLNARVQLNALLLTEATSLAAKAIYCLITGSIGTMEHGLTVEQCTTAVVDLLCWSGVTSLETDTDLAADLAQAVAGRFGVNEFVDAPVVPCLLHTVNGPDVTWQPPAKARRWPDLDLTAVFSDHVAARHADILNLWPIWSVLRTRLERLDDFLDAHTEGYPGEPCAEERAMLVELVASSLASTSRPPKAKWQQFFQEIPDFMGPDAHHLAGRTVLLGDDDQLHKALDATPTTDATGPSPRRRRRRIVAAVFSPPDPRRVSTDNDFKVDPPKSLSNRFAFLTTALPWHEQLSDARHYLESHKLVNEFNREAVLAHLSRTLRGENNKRVLRSGLRWAFQLWRQPRSHGRPVRIQPRHLFRVPTLSGEYIEAREAVFSADWPPETAGRLLQEFLDAAPSGLSDLRTLENRLLAATDDLAFRRRWIDDWVLFLTELGVNTGLTPQLKDSRKNTFPAWKISDFSFLKDYGIPTEFADFWRDDISAQNSSLLQLYYSTKYVIVGPLPWLPGQADIEHFSVNCKGLYATLLLQWLSKDSQVRWDIEVHHQTFHNQDRRRWPTPLKSFLRSARWLPVDERTESSPASKSIRPCDLWAHDSDGDRFEPYLRRPTSRLRLYLERAPGEFIRKLVTHSGLRIFNSPSLLPEQLEYLAQQYTSKSLDHHFERRLLNFYDRTWVLLSKQLDDAEHELDATAAPATILVRRGQSLESVAMLDEDSEEAESIYVCDTDRQGDRSLLEASGKPFIVLSEGDPSSIGMLFETLYGQRIRRLSQVGYSLHADGKKIQNSVAIPVLSVCPQLRTMVAVAMEALTGTEAQRLPADRATILAKLERLTMIKAGRLSFVIDGMDVSAEQDTVSAFQFRLDDGQTVIAIQSSTEWTWALVDRSIAAICEALRHRSLAPHLRLLVAHLRHDDSPREPVSQPFDDLSRFSRLLHISPLASQAAASTLSAGVERHAPFLRAVLYLLAGPAAVEAFDGETDEVLKDAALAGVTLSRLLKDTPVEADDLLEICRTALGASDFRDGLALDFADFNTSLLALGLDPDTYPDLHSSQLKNFINERGIEISDCLRARYAKQLSNMHPVEDYASKRDRLRSVEPDPAWLLAFKEVPDDALAKHVNAWLAENGVPLLGSSVQDMSPLSAVREHNRVFLRSFAARAMSLVRAWCAKFQPEHPMASIALENQTEELRSQLDNIGVMDLRKLDETTAMEWLRVIRIWPTAMELSLDLGTLGLSKEDVEDERVKDRKAKEARKREKRSISFNGRPVDPTTANLESLSQELKSGLSPTVLRKALSSATDLAEKKHDPTHRRKPGDRPPHKGRSPNIPEEKAELIGRLGELTVYHWLRNILPKQDIDAAWRSENG